MNDNGDGTYYFDYSTAQEGTISIFITFVEQGVVANYFPNVNETPPAELTKIHPNIDFNWGSGGGGSKIDYWSAFFDFYFVPTTTEAYTFYTVHDDVVSYTINGEDPLAYLVIAFRTTSNVRFLI